MEDNDFGLIPRILDSCMKDISKDSTKSFNPKQAEVITIEMEEKLWNNGFLGNDNPRKLFVTTFYLIGLNFALRAVKEHHELAVDNFQFETVNGVRCLRFTENLSKTNQGGIRDIKKKRKSVLAYPNEIQPERCICKIYEKFISVRPPNKTELYLKPLEDSTKPIWYSLQNIGVNKLRNVVKDLCKSANFTGFFTNHSLRASAATRLFNCGVEEQLVCNITGHTSTAVREYKRPSVQQMEGVSRCIQGGSQSASQSASTFVTTILPENIPEVTTPAISLTTTNNSVVTTNSTNGLFQFSYRNGDKSINFSLPL